MMRVSILVRYGLLLAVLLVALPYAWAAPTPADQAFNAAKQLYRTENDEPAVAALKQFVATYATDLRVHEANYMLGCCYQRMGKLPEALAAFALVVTKATGADLTRLRAEAHFQMGDCYSQQGAFDKAAQSYDNALKLVTDDKDFLAQALYWKASSLYQLGKGQEALPIYRRVVDKYPDHTLAPWSLYAVGVIQLEGGDINGAILTLQLAQAQYADAEVAGDVKLKLAFAHLQRAGGEKDAAVADAERRQGVGILQELIGDARLSEESRVQAAMALASACIDLKEYDKAVMVCTQTLTGVDPKAQTAMNLRLLLGDAHYNANRFAEAAAAYRTVAENAPTDLALRGRYWEGNACYQQGLAGKDAKAYTQAIVALQRFLKDAGEQNPLTPRATLLIGLSYEAQANLGDVTAGANAVNTYRDVVQKWPDTREGTEAKTRLANQTNEMPLAEVEKLAQTLPPGEALWNVLIRLSRERFLAGKYDDALAYAQRVLNGKPAPDQALRSSYLAAVALTELKRGKEAITLFQQVLANPQAKELKTPAERGLIQACLQEKRYAEARDTALELVKEPFEVKTPAEREAELADRLMLLAQSYVGTQQYPEAETIYQRVLHECPGSTKAPYAMLGSAWVAETRKDLPAANNIYTQFIATYPKHEMIGEAQFRLGANLLALKEYEKAIASLQQVPQAYQFADEAAYKIGWTYREWGKTDEAGAQFQRVVDQFPKSPFAGASLFHLGEAAMDKEQYQNAQALLQRALDLMAADYSLRPYAQLKLGACAYELKDYTRAADAFSALAKNEKAGDQAAEGLFWYARSLEAQGEKQVLPARDAYRQYMTKYPTGGLVLDAQLGAGRAALAAQKYPDARADLQKALDMSATLPANSPQLADRAKSVQPEAQYLLGLTAMAEKQYEDALRLLAMVSVYNLEPWYSNSLLQMARCSALSGNSTAAEKTLALLKKSFPDSAAAKEIPKVAEEFKLTVE